ncbi:transglutaminase family protein [Pseudodonghicola flavimaris]|uniref:Transglutaminase family protein n=1 Tax=Pseudodonghicola flavimaris TaxID=3050036 RepID=A0ABT7F2B6_9RHOB|nr:transglutaminase family protein [Pseudodonghicola flavimaris]MDK3018743.1 transglutaminase family protein [Pseudodonghicola flavimaris]
MRLKITHTTTYTYDEPAYYALQQLRLVPRTGPGQEVLEWSSTVQGGTKQLTFDDQFGNHTELVIADPATRTLEILTEGCVEVSDLNGVIGPHKGYAPLWLFRGSTPLTAPGPQLRQLAARVRSEGREPGGVEPLHALSAMIGEAVAYEAGHTDSTTTAEAALAAGHGVCQDHAQIMIAVARLLGYPARYVSGYLLLDGQVEQDAAHAWAEVWTAGLGWVGFDVSNGICPDARYVRVATGRDYRDAAPIHGLRQGAGDEALHVTLQVQQ